MNISACTPSANRWHCSLSTIISGCNCYIYSVCHKIMFCNSNSCHSFCSKIIRIRRRIVVIGYLNDRNCLINGKFCCCYCILCKLWSCRNISCHIGILNFKSIISVCYVIYSRSPSCIILISRSGFLCPF